MARPKGSPKVGGRQKGTPNKATADVKALARVHAPAAIQELARLMLEAESEPARVAAIKEMMDRAYGKATTMIGGDEDSPLSIVTRIILEAGNGNGGDTITA